MIVFQRRKSSTRQFALPAIQPALVIAVAPLLFLTGCSHSSSPVAPPAGQVAAKTGGPQSVASINANIQKVQSDASISDARKQIMIDQMKHAEAHAPGGSK